MQGLRCHAHGITGEGSTDKGIMLVGVAPGKDEMTSGRPRTGQAGKLMYAILSAAGVQREDVYITNLMCWNQPKPEPHEWVECLARLEEEIREYKPRLIVTCGNIPTDAILGTQRHRNKRTGKPDDRGVTYWDSTRKCYIMPTWEPALVLYSQSVDFASDLLRDFEKIYDVLTWTTDGTRGKDVTYETVYDAKRGQEVMDSIPTDGRFVSVDIETTSPDVEIIDAENDTLLCIGIGWRDDSGIERVYVLRAGACTELLWPAGVRWTFQFGQFDTYGIRRYLGVRLPIVEDTIGLSYCRDERPGRHNLKLQLREYENFGWYEEGIDRRKLELVPPEVTDKYNAYDVAGTLRLAYRHSDAVEKDGMMPFYRNIFIPAANVFRDAQEWGIKVDLDKLEELSNKWHPEREAIAQSIQEMAEREGFQGQLNPRSQPQMAHLIYELLGYEATKFSKKTNKPSVDKFALDAIDHPIAQALRSLRSYDGSIGLILNLLENLKPDCRIHARPMLHNASTGRMAYQDPPLHGLPQSYTVGDELARLSEALIPSNDEWEIAKADYQSLEVWVAYFYSKDEQLLADLMTGDIHSQTAEGAFNVKHADYDHDTTWQPYRQDAKKVRFGIGYGESAYGLAMPRPKGIGRPVRECQIAIDNFWIRYPKHKAITLEWERQALNEGVLISGGGRKRRFPLVLDPRQLRQAINFPVQGTATDYAITAAIELAPQLAKWNAHILFLWHDAIIPEYPVKYRNEVLSLVKSVMEKPRLPGFGGVPVEIKVGRNLGEMKKVKVA